MYYDWQHPRTHPQSRSPVVRPTHNASETSYNIPESYKLVQQIEKLVVYIASQERSQDIERSRQTWVIPTGIELLYKSDDTLRFPMNKQYPDDERQKILTCIAVQTLVDSLLQIDIMRVASETDNLYLANVFLYLLLLRGDHIDGASELYKIIHTTRWLFQVVRPCTFQTIT